MNLIEKLKKATEENKKRAVWSICIHDVEQDGTRTYLFIGTDDEAKARLEKEMKTYGRLREAEKDDFVDVEYYDGCPGDVGDPGQNRKGIYLYGCVDAGFHIDFTAMKLGPADVVIAPLKNREEIMNDNKKKIITIGTHRVAIGFTPEEYTKIIGAPRILKNKYDDEGYTEMCDLLDEMTEMNDGCDPLWNFPRDEMEDNTIEDQGFIYVELCYDGVPRYFETILTEKEFKKQRKEVRI